MSLTFLTEEGDLVLDPFAGSNTTGAVAEELKRKWIAIEKNHQYLADSELRFQCPTELATREPDDNIPEQILLFESVDD